MKYDMPVNLRCINDTFRECSLNIALDEAVFTASDFMPAFRFYRWTGPAYTIGYFQKFKDVENPGSLPVVRRMTGGLTVLHDKDLSFSFTASEEIWPHIYDQEKTYSLIHGAFRAALKKINIFCDESPAEKPRPAKNFSCVETFYKDDLFLNGRKIAGSCQRRRGKRILVEGSLHIRLDDKTTEKFANIFFEEFSKVLNCKTVPAALSEYELKEGLSLAGSKYKNDKWTKLF